MDELMDEGATAEEALIGIPQAILDAKAAATDIATRIDDKVYSRHPTSCGNERWMKNAGFFKSCVKRGKEVCPTCRLVEVSAVEIFVREEPRSERGAVVAGEVLLRVESFATYEVIVAYEVITIINPSSFLTQLLLCES
jgi:hypothetical protein